MRKKLVNKKVINSIGIGIMAFITATTPVLNVAAEESSPDPVETGNPDEGKSSEQGNNAVTESNEAKVEYEKITADANAAKDAAG